MIDYVQSALAISFIVKIVIDTFRLVDKTSSRKYLPILALLIGIGIAVLIDLAQTPTVSIQRLAVNIIIGIIAGGNAIGVTEMQKRGQNVPR